jgi:hypothetical protein
VDVRRSVAVLGVLACMAISTSPASAVSPQATSPDVAVQTIVGGGTGTISISAQFPFWNGGYSSTSQLGQGRYSIGGSLGDAEFVRSDGMTLHGEWNPFRDFDDCGPLGPDVHCHHFDFVGSADIASAHLVVALVFPHDALDHGTPAGFLMRGTLTLRHRLSGYAMLDTTGTTYAFGGLDHLGDAHTSAATDVELTPSRRGQWIVNRSGQVFAFGDASYLGNADTSSFAPGETVTNMSATPTGKGYWLFTSKGRAVPFGDAHFLGDIHGTPLNGPIVGSIATPTGKGYYMVGSDGGVFAFGDAAFRGSMGNVRLNRPVVGLVPTADNDGYWLVAADGGVFSFNAPFHGSMGGVKLNRPIVTMVPYAGAYLMVASDGGIFNFSRPFLRQPRRRAALGTHRERCRHRLTKPPITADLLGSPRCAPSGILCA